MLSLAATKRRSALSEALSPERGVEHYRAVDAGVRPRDAFETSVRLLNRAQPRRVRGELGCLRRGRPVRGRHLSVSAGHSPPRRKKTTNTCSAQTLRAIPA